jgi:hypothetical protein
MIQPTGPLSDGAIASAADVVHDPRGATHHGGIARGIRRGQPIDFR